MFDLDDEDVEYFRARMFEALTVPKEYTNYTNKPIWRGDLDEDFYIVRWCDLSADMVTEVFPDALETRLDDVDDRLAFYFKDICGNKQFIIESKEGKSMASHGSHTLSPAQYSRLNNAGATFY